jgi:hypothetical protein
MKHLASNAELISENHSLSFPYMNRIALAEVLNNLSNDGLIEGWWWMREFRTGFGNIGFCSKQDADLAAVYWLVLAP